MRHQLQRLFVFIVFFGIWIAAHAACTTDGSSGGILKLDRCDEFEATGIFSRKYQQLLDAVVIGGTLGVALWEGTESTAGETAWKSLDAMAVAAVTTEVMKNVFQRPRPSESSDPNLWRQGRGYKSFPSGETATMAAFVTPIILENHEEHPWVWSLVTLPLYMAEARMRSQGHWLSDVVVGAAVGITTGTWAAQRDNPLLLAFTKDGVFVGIKHRF